MALEDLVHNMLWRNIFLLFLILIFVGFRQNASGRKKRRLTKPTDSYPSALLLPATNVFVKSLVRCYVRFDGKTFPYSFLSRCAKPQPFVAIVGKLINRRRQRVDVFGINQQSAFAVFD